MPTGSPLLLRKMQLLTTIRYGWTRRCCPGIRMASSQSSSNRVGFIGLGNMGSHMARNLLKKGQSVMIYDVYPEAMAALEGQGAVAARSLTEIADSCSKIITMLPSSPHCTQVYTGDGGLLKSDIKEGTLLIDCSTIDPATSKEISASAVKRGATFCDAPVSGGVMGARDAALTFMVGCDSPEDFDAIRTLLSLMGKNVVHCGSVGMGEAAKICNNMVTLLTFFLLYPVSSSIRRSFIFILTAADGYRNGGHSRNIQPGHTVRNYPMEVARNQNLNI
ncbi:hypothetical protein RvY_18814-2 [Ramazzottius varieornatus]|uniref:3-hydroxyisobutyrate dehydrogenase n=1 Tax=Ramazzottius varieornatus TaxID=947166 RepID=A0A1D1W769_RAMVA|nr:hypothetical protein RvY_18814-2 [Ramazzottius varieornatus]